MDSQGSVTILLRQLSDPAAAQSLYERYVQQLVALANRKLAGVPRAVVDGEDVAQLVFQSFFSGCKRFPKLNDRHDLWQILLMLTERRCLDQKRKHGSQKRGGGRILGESALGVRGDADTSALGMQAVAGPEPTPEDAEAAVKQLEFLFGELTDPRLRQIAVWKLQGYTNQEIAERLQRCSRTVDRALDAIRAAWQTAD